MGLPAAERNAGFSLRRQYDRVVDITKEKRRANHGGCALFFCKNRKISQSLLLCEKRKKIQEIYEKIKTIWIKNRNIENRSDVFDLFQSVDNRFDSFFLLDKTGFDCFFYLLCYNDCW